MKYDGYFAVATREEGKKCILRDYHHHAISFTRMASRRWQHHAQVCTICNRRHHASEAPAFWSFHSNGPQKRRSPHRKDATTSRDKPTASKRVRFCRRNSGGRPAYTAVTRSDTDLAEHKAMGRRETRKDGEKNRCVCENGNQPGPSCYTLYTRLLSGK